MLFITFMSALISVLTFGVIGASASNSAYDGVSIDIVEHIKMATYDKDFIRSISFGILKFIAKIIDYVQSAIDEILSLDMKSMFEAITGFTDTYPLAWVVLSVSMMISAIILAACHEKLKIKETITNILVCCLLVLSLPTLISSLQEMKTSGLRDVNNIEVGDNDYSLGDELLSSNIIRVSDSVSNNRLQYYSDVANGQSRYNRNPGSVYNLSINDVHGSTDDVLNEKILSITTPLNYELQYPEPLNVSSQLKLINPGINIIYQEFLMFSYLDVKGHRSYDGKTYCLANHNDNDIGYHCSLGATSQGTWERCIIELIASDQKIIDIGMSDFIKSKSTVLEALGAIDSQLKRWNKVTIERSELVGNYTSEKLLGELQYDKLDTIDKILQVIGNRTTSEHIYRYDFDFWFTFFFLLVTAVSLFYACLKVSGMLFSIMITQLIAPVLIATDTQNSGRAKTVIKNLISYYAMFVFIALLLKVYIISVDFIHDHIENYILQIILTIIFGVGIRNAPDDIARMAGVEAGGRNGLGSMFAISTIMRAAGGATRGVRSVGRMAGGAAGKAMHGAATVAGGALGAAASLVAPMAAKAPSNFKAASNAIGNTGFTQNHPAAGKALSGIAGAANAVTGGIAGKTLSNANYQGMSRDNAISKATQTSPSKLGDSIAKGATNFAKGALAGAKAGNALSHGQFRQAGNTVSNAVKSASQIRTGSALNTSAINHNRSTPQTAQSNISKQPTNNIPVSADNQKISGTSLQPSNPQTSALSSCNSSGHVKQPYQSKGKK